MNHLHRSVLVQSRHLLYPILVLLQHLLIVNTTQPKIYLSVVLLYFHTNSIQLLMYFLFSRNIAQKNFLPHSIAFSPLESQHKSSTVFIMLVLPHWLDFFLEKVEVWANRKWSRSFEVLIVSPEVLSSGNISNRMQTVFEIALSFNESLVPKLERPNKFKTLSLFLHKYLINNLWSKMYI